MPETKAKPSPYTKPPRVELLSRDGKACKRVDAADQVAEAGKTSIKPKAPAPAPAAQPKSGGPKP